jgi:hypothetical protein
VLGQKQDNNKNKVVVGFLSDNDVVGNKTSGNSREEEIGIEQGGDKAQQRVYHNTNSDLKIRSEIDPMYILGVIVKLSLFKLTKSDFLPYQNSGTSQKDAAASDSRSF